MVGVGWGGDASVGWGCESGLEMLSVGRVGMWGGVFVCWVLMCLVDVFGSLSHGRGDLTFHWCQNEKARRGRRDKEKKGE